MKHLVFVALILSLSMAMAQTAAKPAAHPSPKPGAGVAASTGGLVKLPPGVPRVHGVVKTAFSLRYQDIKLGTGAEAEPNKIYKVLYTGYLASDGRKFDSSDDHRMPLKDKDGKPVMGDDGKPKLADPEPINFPQGFGRVIPGFDQGFGGMKIGGKRRLFIPWQLAYGARGRPGPDPEHPGIPPKADLIFDIELVDVTDMQMPMGHPMGNPMRPGMPLPPGHPQFNTHPPTEQPGASGATAPKAGTPQPNGNPASQPAQPQPQKQ